jgi:hypothetical protein
MDCFVSFSKPLQIKPFQVKWHSPLPATYVYMTDRAVVISTWALHPLEAGQGHGQLRAHESRGLSSPAHRRAFLNRLKSVRRLWLGCQHVTAGELLSLERPAGRPTLGPSCRPRPMCTNSTHRITVHYRAPLRSPRIAAFSSRTDYITVLGKLALFWLRLRTELNSLF